MKMHFYGGARTVTGANYLVETESARVLVDCGMFQGVKHAEERNYEPFPYEPRSIDAVVLTHAHLDHSGRIPKLYKEGFRGPVYSTPPTKDLTELVLRDSVGLIANEARRDRHEPLYGEEDIQPCVQRLCVAQPYGTAFDAARGIRVRLRNAGHVLGSAIAEMEVEENGDRRTVVFSGDLGSASILLAPRETVERADVVVVESVYGNRIHEPRDERRRILADIVRTTAENGGVLLIPAFALERTQELLYDLNELVEGGLVPRVPVFLDSPLAIRATAVFRAYADYFNEGVRRQIASGDQIFQFPGLQLTESVEASKAINAVLPPKIIIAGSGMSTGGRVIHHERRYLSDRRNAIVFIGYQAAGTLGRRIFDGQREVRILGERISVRARVEAIGGYSGHADHEELLEWIGAMAEPPGAAYVVQGEEGPAMEVAQSIRDRLSIPASAPLFGDVVSLG